VILTILAVHPEACFDCTSLDRRLRLAAAAALAGQPPWPEIFLPLLRVT
jgi:hypothetical protein